MHLKIAMWLIPWTSGEMDWTLHWFSFYESLGRLTDPFLEIGIYKIVFELLKHGHFYIDKWLLMYIFGYNSELSTGPPRLARSQDLGLAWILQNRRWQRRHTTDVANTVAALPAKNWPWRPWSMLLCLLYFLQGYDKSFSGQGPQLWHA